MADDKKPRYAIRCVPGGAYVKVGGGYTDRLQEAQVVGWLSPKKGRYARYKSSHEFVPVEIVIKKRDTFNG